MKNQTFAMNRHGGAQGRWRTARLVLLALAAFPCCVHAALLTLHCVVPPPSRSAGLGVSLVLDLAKQQVDGYPARFTGMAIDWADGHSTNHLVRATGLLTRRSNGTALVYSCKK